MSLFDKEITRQFGDAELANVARVLQSGLLSSKYGKATQTFEGEFATRWGAKHGVAMNSAMSALHAAVAAARVGPGDEVICDPIVTFGGAAVMYNNGVPVFADVDPDTFNMDPKSLVERVTPRTKAIICTHLFGLPCDMDPIMQIAREHNLLVIEDCAQALGAKYKGRFVGTIGDIGVFSFEQSKHMTSGDGGIAVCNDENLADQMRSTRLIGWVPAKSGNPAERWKAGRLGWNFRITEMASAVLLAQLAKVDEIIASHVNPAKECLDIAGHSRLLRPQYVHPGNVHAYWRIAFRYEGDKYGVELDEFKSRLQEEGPEFSYGYTQVPATLVPLFTEVRAYGKGCPIRCPLYAGEAKYGAGVSPVAEELLRRLFIFPRDRENMLKVVKVLERLRTACRETTESSRRS